MTNRAALIAVLGSLTHFTGGQTCINGESYTNCDTLNSGYQSFNGNTSALDKRLDVIKHQAARNVYGWHLITKLNSAAIFYDYESWAYASCLCKRISVFHLQSAFLSLSNTTIWRRKSYMSATLPCLIAKIWPTEFMIHYCDAATVLSFKNHRQHDIRSFLLGWEGR